MEEFSSAPLLWRRSTEEDPRSTSSIQSTRLDGFDRRHKVPDLSVAATVAGVSRRRTFHAMPPRAWSLADELSTLAHAVEATRRVADTATLPSDTAHDPVATAVALAGTLALVTTRLRDLGRVVRGEIDPRLLWAPHNAVEPDALGSVDDVIFRAWGPKRRAAEARRELARVERERARRRR